MKKKKKIWMLVGLSMLLFCLLVVLIGIKKNDFNKIEESPGLDEEETVKLLPEINEEKTRKISIYLKNGEKISFYKDDEWNVGQNEKFPLKQETVNNIFDILTSLSVERTMEGVENLSEYGLDIPANIISIETDDGERKSISIGAQNEGNGCTYVYLDDKTDVVYTVARYLNNLFTYDLYDFAESETYPVFDNEGVRTVEVQKSENSFEIIYDIRSETGWTVEDERYGSKVADDESCENLTSMVQVLGYSKFYEYDCQDFGKYGLDNPQMEIRVEYIEMIDAEGESSEDENEDLANKETVRQEFVMYVGDFDEDGYYYVRLNDSTQVHGIAQIHIDRLLEMSSIEYWPLNMSEISLEDLDYLEVEYDGKCHVLKHITTEKTSDDFSDDSENSSDVSKKEGDSEKNATTEEMITTYYVNDKEVDEDVFKTFYQYVIGITCQERRASLELEHEAELIFNFYGVNGQKVTVAYIPWDGSFYAAVNNDNNFGLVNKMDIKNVLNLLLEITE